MCGDMVTERKGKRMRGVLVMIDYVASTMCYSPDVKYGKLEHVGTWMRLPRRSRILGTSSAGDEYVSAEQPRGRTWQTWQTS